MKKKKILLYLLVGAVLIFFLSSSDWKEVFANMKSISIKTVIIVFILQIITMILIAFQWKSMASWAGQKTSFINTFIMNSKGNIVDAITPGVKVGGEVARVYELMNTLNINLASATIIVGLQKTVSMLSFLFLSLISLLWFNFNIGIEYKNYQYLFSAVVTVFSMLLSILILLCLKPDIIKNLLNKIFPNSKIKEKIDIALKEYNSALTRLLTNKNQFFYQMLLGIFIWGLFAFKMLLIVKDFNIKMSFISIGAITYLTYIMGMIPLLPGSVGSFESSMVALLSIQGVPMEMGISISLVFRFLTFWFEFIFSLLVFILYKLISLLGKGGKYA